MIRSMTGFGRGEARNENYKVVIEMKSVNHRYCDISIRLPRKLNCFESLVRNLTKNFADRGKIDIFVSLEDTNCRHTGIKYNKDIAGAYLNGIHQIATDFQLRETVDAGMLSRFPDVFTMEEPEMDQEVLETLLTAAVQEAGEQLSASRRLEGENLRTDLLEKLDYILEIVEKIKKRSPEVLAAYRQRLTEKVEELLSDTPMDQGILATELVVYADKICVDEEMVRLTTHVAHMKETLRNGGSIGRKLDFLTQEMNREANTTLSKANDIQISEFGIELKTEIEKIKEQIQNIE